MEQCFFLASLSIGAYGDSTTYADGINGYAEKVRDWMSTNRYYSGIFDNQAKSGNHAWSNLVRLTAEMLSFSPDHVLSNVFQTADADTAMDLKSGEAIIRRTWAARPTARQMAVLMPKCDAGITEVLALGQFQTDQLAIFANYSIPVIDFRAYCVANIGDLATLMTDTLHPSTAGHAQIATMIEDYYTANPTFLTDDADHSTLPARVTDCADYENTPIRTAGVDADAETGAGWATVSTTGRQSSTAGDTITFVATCQSYGLYGNETGVFTVSVDGGAFGSVAVDANGVSLATRAEHTIVFKVVSGTLKVLEFWAV